MTTVPPLMAVCPTLIWLDLVTIRQLDVTDLMTSATKIYKGLY